MVVEVILQSKVAGLGVEADVVKVKPGYARNYLFPKGLASVSTSASKKQVEVLKRKRAEREAQELNDAQEFVTKLGKVKLNFSLVMGGAQEKAFGSVTAQDIADKLKEAGFDIDRRKIDLPKAIKDAGEHEVVVHVHPEVQAKLHVVVVAGVVEKKEGYRGGKEPRTGGRPERSKSRVDEAAPAPEEKEKPAKSESRKREKKSDSKKE